MAKPIIVDKIDNSLQIKNWIINGQFDVWQRGTSQTSAGYNSDDRWYNDHTISTKTHSRQAFTVGQTDVPNNPTYFSRTVVTSGNAAGSQVSKGIKIEDITKLAGKTATLSFWAKADTNKNVSTEFYQDFGTGGSDFITSLGVQKHSLTTAWQRFTSTVALPSVSGKTIGVGSSTLLFLWFDAGSDSNTQTNSLGNQSGTFDIANVCLVEGSTAVECPAEPYADVLRKCQRYYYRVGNEVSNQFLANGIGQSSTNASFMIWLPNMRIPPTVLSFASLLAYNGSSLIAITNVTIDRSSEQTLSITVTAASGLSAGQAYFLLSTADLNGYIAVSSEL